MKETDENGKKKKKGLTEKELGNLSINPNYAIAYQMI